MSFFALDDIPYERIIIAEPSMVDCETFFEHFQDRDEQLEGMFRAISARRSRWDSHEAAFAWFSKRKPWTAWDPRIVRIFAVRRTSHITHIVRVELHESAD